MYINAKASKPLPYYTPDMLEDIQQGRIRVTVGVNQHGDGSRRLLKGQNLRQPMIRGDRAPMR